MTLELAVTSVTAVLAVTPETLHAAMAAASSIGWEALRRCP